MTQQRLSIPQRFAAWVVRRRSSLPRWVNERLESVAKDPTSLVSRVATRLLGGGSAPPPPTEIPDAPVRVYIGPTNYAEQGWRWARALEEHGTGIGARNMALEIPGTFSFRADSLVPLVIQNGSASWSDAEFDAVRRFSHVLIEAERSLFGPRFGWDIERERLALDEDGVSVAFMAHGTDVRSPRRHRTLTPWSPFEDPEQFARLQADADANIEFLERVGRPIFASTPDLLVDVPQAVWCPVVVDVARWQAETPPRQRPRPVVMHVPSSPQMKGTTLIADTIQRLDSDRTIDLKLTTGVASASMPALVATSDIVLDQFRLGSYGAAAIEAMAAGRVVVGHVLESVRSAVFDRTGVPLPIVEATPDTLEQVLLELVADRERMARVSAESAEFVRIAHSGQLSARTLLKNWIELD